MALNKIDPQAWKADLPAFQEMLEKFQTGEVKKPAYKGFSGFYGSYAQKDQSVNMLRLRMTAGRATPVKLGFVADAVRVYGAKRAHFTTCQAIQLHDLDAAQTCTIMEKALDAGIVTIGGGGDFPRNVMCSPLSGVEQGEYFDVLPYAEAAAEFLMNFVKAEKMPRKLKVCFSNSPKNLPHATFRDLGFAARPDGKFDVYSAGGLGNNPRFGVKVAEAVAPTDILYYIKAMWLTFRTYGNYENRGKARTRYMQEVCGGAEGYKAAYLEKLEEVLASGEDLTFVPNIVPVTKTGDGSAVSGSRVIAQKQEGLYAVAWHPVGGQPDLRVLCAVADAIREIPAAELRLSPDEGAYIINLTGSEAEKLLALTESNTAKTRFETSVSCIGASTCQVGLRDSQALLHDCVQAVAEAGIPDGALPQIHISGCPSSCGTHQIAPIGFRGHTKFIDKTPNEGFMLFAGGCDRQGEEAMGKEVGVLLRSDVPAFLVELGRAVAESGMEYAAWVEKNPGGVEEIAAKYI